MRFKQKTAKWILQFIGVFTVLMVVFIGLFYGVIPTGLLTLLCAGYLLVVTLILRYTPRVTIEVTDTCLIAHMGRSSADELRLPLDAMESVFMRTVRKDPIKANISECDLYLEFKGVDGTILELPYLSHGKHFYSMITLVVSGREGVLFDTLVNQKHEGFTRILSEIMQGKISPQPYLENGYME